MYDHLKTSRIARNDEIEQLQKLSGQMQRQEAAIRQQKAPQAYTSAALWQGKKASNPRPTVLETVALPTELFPYMIKKWWAFRDLNPGPTGYEPVALTN